MSDAMPLQEVEPARRVACAIDDISVARRAWERKNRRPSTLSAREALMVLEFEATFVAVCSSNLADGMQLSESDHRRLWLAQNRITTIVGEVTG